MAARLGRGNFLIMASHYTPGRPRPPAQKPRIVWALHDARQIRDPAWPQPLRSTRAAPGRLPRWVGVLVFLALNALLWAALAWTLPHVG